MAANPSKPRFATTDKKSFEVDVKDGGALEIEFVHRADNQVVSGIEVEQIG